MKRLAFALALGLSVIGAIDGQTPTPSTSGPGSLDATFGPSPGGRVGTRMGTSVDYCLAAALQSDGKILAAGETMNHEGNKFAFVRYNADGSRDSSFGVGGKLAVAVGKWGQARDVALQSDGKIVAAGSSTEGAKTEFGLVRLHPNGSLDFSFGEGGKVRTGFGPKTDEANAVAIQADGKIVAAGASTIGTGALYPRVFALARYKPDGTLDASFGNGGKVTTVVGTEWDEIKDIAVQPDGKIVAVGESETLSSNSNGWQVVVVRYSANGSLDPAFGNGGKVTLNLGSDTAYPSSLAMQPDGRLVIVGDYYQNNVGFDAFAVRLTPDGSFDPSFGSGGLLITDLAGESDNASAVALDSSGRILIGGSAADVPSGFAVMRLTASGTLDTTFGSGGIASTSPSGRSSVSGLIVQPDGRFVAAGFATNSADYHDADFALVRFHANGTPDAGFGASGTVQTEVLGGESAVHALAVQQDGKILAAGFAGYGPSLDSFRAFALARYLPNGSPDPTFGSGGQVRTALSDEDDQVHAVAVQPDGRILAAGHATFWGARDFALIRYLPDGSLDESFGNPDIYGNAATVYTAFGGEENDVVHALAVQPNGRIVAVGYATQDSQRKFAMARYLANGSLDTSFGNGGTVVTAFGTGNAVAYAAALQPDGKIVVAGRSGSNAFALVRYNANGSLDTVFGVGGKTVVQVGTSWSVAKSLVLQPDGKIVAAGTAKVGASERFALARFKSNGILDSSFGTGGKVTTDVALGNDAAHGLALQSDGKLVVAGTSRMNSTARSSFVRYHKNGTLDTTFDSDGKKLVNWGAVQAVTLQNDGRIVAAGSARMGAYRQFALLRLLP